ncbi:MAG: rRNA pseudouridine synthase [Bacteroides sp.]|nr:rRNA pseudouridine synthase [Bacillota bacterium]MCM1393922.1 rRNA pseudouridine synthase [[Eubacterium] siraeum]MCM1456138.1 rRNA pseudouridine synthase [Bacteroides sp.]
MRINKYLAECGVCSRRKADEYVKAGRVSVNKKIVREVGTEINEDSDVVYVDGKKVVHATHYDYIMFNKPKGCVTTMDDSRDDKSGRKKQEDSAKNTAKQSVLGADNARQNAAPEVKKPRKTVVDYLGEYKDKRLHPVGRLDYDSEGLLLLTNDGDMTFKLTHPSSEIPKTYIVKIEGSIEESDLAILRKGVSVDGVKYGRCKVKVTGVEDGNTRLEVVIFEGKNREIRRMFEAVEKNVTFLKRVAIGELRLGGLSRGGYRELNEGEIAYLVKLCGLER